MNAYIARTRFDLRRSWASSGYLSISPTDELLMLVLLLLSAGLLATVAETAAATPPSFVSACVCDGAVLLHCVAHLPDNFGNKCVHRMGPHGRLLLDQVCSIVGWFWERGT